MNILGINAFHGDASAAVVVDGTLVAAVEEERFTRIKHDASFPIHAVRYCLDDAGLRPEDLDHIAISRNPFANLGRRSAFAVASAAGRRMIPTRSSALIRTLRVKQILARGLGTPDRQLRARIHWVEHHLAHIASSFFVSPFDRAAVLSVDGFGDMVSSMWGVGEGTRLRMLGEVGFPHSLGVFYTAFTQYLGFPAYGDEYKVMGLSSYGEPAYLEEMRRIVRREGEGYRLDLAYFRHHREGASMTWEAGSPELEPLWGDRMTERLGPPRTGVEEPLEGRHGDVACSMQRRLEEIVLAMLRDLHAKTRLDDLCMAGGVALNCVVNGMVTGETPFRRLFIIPAPNDAGTSVGAAFFVQHHRLGQPRNYVMRHAYLGPQFEVDRCRRALKDAGVDYEELPGPVLIDRTADALAAGRIVGWYQGRMEFGPRALGNRSILADPRSAEMKDILNARVKHREAFRPFAPSILQEATGQYFTEASESPYMLLAYPVRPEKRRQIPAPTHVDGTGRLQTVRREQNERFYDLLKAFESRTGVPVLLNTSFNDNEPICCTPEQAVETFLRTRMDVLVVGDLYAKKRSS